MLIIVKRSDGDSTHGVVLAAAAASAEGIVPTDPTPATKHASKRAKVVVAVPTAQDHVPVTMGLPVPAAPPASQTPVTPTTTPLSAVKRVTPPSSAASATTHGATAKTSASSPPATTPTKATKGKGAKGTAGSAGVEPASGAAACGTRAGFGSGSPLDAHLQRPVPINVIGIAAGYEFVSNHVTVVLDGTNVPITAVLSHGTAKANMCFTGILAGVALGSTAVARFVTFTPIHYPAFRVLPLADDALTLTPDMSIREMFTMLGVVCHAGQKQSVGVATPMNLRVVEICVRSSSGAAHYAHVNFWGERGDIAIQRGNVMLFVGVNVRSFKQTASYQVQRTTCVLPDVRTDQARELKAWYAEQGRHVGVVELPPGARLLRDDEMESGVAVEVVEEVAVPSNANANTDGVHVQEVDDDDDDDADEAL